MTADPVPRWLYWTPRVLGVLFAVFISLFALDVFGEHYPPGQLLTALAMHLVPTALVLAALLVAWRREGIGALLFIGLGAYYVASSWGHYGWDAHLAIAGPLVLTGLLFLLGWLRRTGLPSRDGTRRGRGVQ
jgi:hypothetical protein